MDINKKLDAMVGMEYIYVPKQLNIVVKKWWFEHDVIRMETTGGDFVCPFGEHDAWIKNNFLPVEKEKTETQLSLRIAKAPEHSVFNGNTLSQLRDTLMENIERVKNEKEFIPQASAINEQVKSIIELAKVEVDFYKTASSLSK